MRRHSTAVSTRWILRYLRVDDSWGASVARDAARALASTVSTARAAKNARFNIVGFCSPPPTPFASWRGFAVGSHRAEHDIRANRGGRGGGARAQAIELNREIIASRSAGEILAIVEDRGESFNGVNVATAVNKLCKVSRARDKLRRDPRYKHLLELVQKNANEMNPQEIANVLNALSKLDAASAAVSREGWSHFSVAAERHAVAMNAQEVSTTLNAYAEMRKRRPQASAAVTETGWHSLAAATARTAPTMTNQAIALTVDAAKKLNAFASAIDDEGWEILAAAVARMALDFNAQQTVLALSAVGWKQELARSLHRQGGFDALIGSIERNIDAIRRGYPPDFAKQTRKTLDAIRLIYEHEDGAYGDQRLERLRTELQTKPGNRQK